MNLNTFEAGKETVAEVLEDGVVISSVQDALDLLATAYYQEGASCLMLFGKNMLPDFFDLRTGVAGEILQKYTNYGMRIVIVGDFGSLESRSFKAFILESNRGKQVAFMPDRAAALAHIASW